MDNPLLQASHIPVDYPSITLENMASAFDHVLREHELGIERIIEKQHALPTWDDLVLAIDGLDAQLLAVLYAVLPLVGKGAQWAQSFGNYYGKTVARFDQKFTNSRLLALYERLASTANGVNLDASKRATLRWHLAKFAASGALLSEKDKAHLLALQAQIVTLRGQFLGNLTRPGLLIDNEAELLGLRQKLRDQLAARARQEGKQGWLIDCESAVTESVLRHSKHRPLREKVCRAYHLRGVSADAQMDNGNLLQQLAELLDEKAHLLGHANHLELSLQSKSAGSASQVREFLHALALAVRPAMAKWRAQLEQLAVEQGLPSVEPWDVDALQEATGQAHDDETFREHFPLSVVVTALKNLAQQLFALELRPTHLPTWDESVQTFEVWQDHALIGCLYLDAAGHTGKQPDAVYTNYVRNRRVDAEGIYQAAVVVVTTDIPMPLAGAEPLLDHLSLRKLYHEFGHALHHLLVRTGTHVMSNVTELGTDGVELFGKLFERWIWDASYLASIAAPRQDGLDLSRAEAERYLGALRQANLGETGRLLSLALFDLDVHSTPLDGRSIRQRLADARERCGYWPLADFERPAHAFDYLATGYDAGFYAYLWSDVHAFDLFSRFEANGLLDRATGKALQEALFEPGASRPLKEGLEVFLQRSPNQDAYLRWNGLA
ncbi:M3 family metallopeptidase [Pseudomonas sp. NBRC 111124]|uniref:M3 family metallopeptidase n=1 Tax=Pseudomonas sp. NBRC 111124 TaxID=1661039 RepID=UPI00076105F3|nr:M3 family metallopeptidase [Pseudomonas sp. NBRC 111124]